MIATATVTRTGLGRADLPAAADRPLHRPRRQAPAALGQALGDAKLKVEIARVHAEHVGVYGAGKVWRQHTVKESRRPAAPWSG
jgi:hypothetical protein